MHLERKRSGRKRVNHRVKLYLQRGKKVTFKESLENSQSHMIERFPRINVESAIKEDIGQVNFHLMLKEN